VLVYGGDADFVCNVLGIEAWTDALEWREQAGYKATEGRTWQTTDGQ
jgi:cathepsin A (carboxypeptidase C)